MTTQKPVKRQLVSSPVVDGSGQEQYCCDAQKQHNKDLLLFE
jgi:hypothetical protein